MKKLLTISLLLILGHVQAADHDPKNIVPLLKGAKLSLLEGIDYAVKLSGVGTSAKFEVDKGKLILSVYTVPEGLGVEPEKASLTEIAVAVAESPISPKAKVFEDKAHIARASVHMTLFQLSSMTLRKVVETALRRVPGTPIDVRNPMVRNRRAVADVVIVDYEQNAHVVTVDLVTGRTRSALHP